MNVEDDTNDNQTITDKDSKVVVNKPEIFIETSKVNLGKDEKVDLNILQPIEKLMNKTNAQ